MTTRARKLLGRRERTITNADTFKEVRSGLPPCSDLGQTVRRIAEEFTAAHPEREVKLKVVGDSRGRWDDMRIGQAVASLLTNAFRYASPR
jgi:hypothetical protein